MKHKRKILLKWLSDIGLSHLHGYKSLRQKVVTDQKKDYCPGHHFRSNLLPGTLKSVSPVLATADLARLVNEGLISGEGTTLLFRVVKIWRQKVVTDQKKDYCPGHHFRSNLLPGTLKSVIPVLDTVVLARLVNDGRVSGEGRPLLLRVVQKVRLSSNLNSGCFSSFWADIILITSWTPFYVLATFLFLSLIHI